MDSTGQTARERLVKGNNLIHINQPVPDSKQDSSELNEQAGKESLPPHILYPKREVHCVFLCIGVL